MGLGRLLRADRPGDRILAQGVFSHRPRGGVLGGESWVSVGRGIRGVASATKNHRSLYAFGKEHHLGRRCLASPNLADRLRISVMPPLNILTNSRK